MVKSKLRVLMRQFVKICSGKGQGEFRKERCDKRFMKIKLDKNTVGWKMCDIKNLSNKKEVKSKNCEIKIKSDNNNVR